MTAQNEGALVATKLQPPTAPGALVQRSRLAVHLDAAVTGPEAFVLVSAPAGSGKSTLLAGWLAGRTAPVAWLQVEETDSDPARFWAYLVAAIGRSVPSIEERLHPAVVASGRDETALIAGLVNELGARTEPLVVVIDDYHSIDSPEIHRGVERLIERCPDGVTIMIATRIDPPFRLGRLRVRGHLAEVRAADLRFAPDEAAELLSSRLLEAPLLDRLCERTEGWAAGLVLAGISLGTVSDVESFVDSFRGDDQLVVEYLSDELLTSLSPEDRRRLLETSVLSRFDGHLVDAVTGSTDGSAWLGRTAAHNQLLIGLDRTATWFRYHHLLRDLLRLQLERTDPARLRELNLIAGAWHRDHGDLNEAVEHFLAGGDLETAADVIADNATELLNGGQMATVRSQLDRLGDLPERHVGAAVVRGWTDFATGRVAAAKEWYATADRIDVDGTDTGLISSLGLVIHLAEGDVAAALTVADRAPDPADSTQSYAHTVVRTWAGQFDQARSCAAFAAERAAAEPSDFVATALPGMQAIVESEAGSSAAAAEHAARAVAYAAAHGFEETPQLGISHCILARTASDPEVVDVSAHRGVELARRTSDLPMLAYALASAGDALCGIGAENGPAMVRESRSILGRCPDPGIVGSYLARVEARHRVADSTPAAVGLVEELTEREVAVLRFLPTQLSQREIASELFVSLNTVKSHSKAIYRKLGVGDRKSAVQAARTSGLL